MEEAHANVCEVHQSMPKLQDRVKRMGYYWPIMVCDFINFVKRCDACQLHANFIQQPQEPLHPTVVSWPFEAWEMDFIGPFTLKSSVGHTYIVASMIIFSNK